ncbi:unnamed protein product [Lepeophtheirus salmonis]|uniref:(salmon louse) hypothetical protein n=1 Tax=Lepeophtheirus salmonis TaxID=72036 RepID=A0A817FEX1_LEPSM|nr:unnamed protein product [Lepeophtheirus salmonis]
MVGLRSANIKDTLSAPLQRMGRVLGLVRFYAEAIKTTPSFQKSELRNSWNIDQSPHVSLSKDFLKKYNENKIDSPTEKRLPTQPKNHNVSPAQPSADNQAPPSLQCPKKLKRFCILNNSVNIILTRPIFLMSGYRHFHKKTKLYLRKGNKCAIRNILPPVSSLNISLNHLTPTESPEKNFAQLILVPSQDNDKKEPNTHDAK